MDDRRISHRSRLVAGLLCFFLGTFGAHRYYVGKVGTGLLMLVTLGGLGLWYLIDLIMILVGAFRDDEGLLVYDWLEPQMEEREELNARLKVIEERLTDTQDVMIALSEKYDRLEAQYRDFKKES
jgi:TM2 domain-containing membrane protein YozV